MPRWMRFLGVILILAATVPGGASGWQWALLRAIPSPSPTFIQAAGFGFGSSLAVLGNGVLVGNPNATGGPLAGGAGYLINPATGVVVQTFYNPSASVCPIGLTVAAAGGAAWVGSYATGTSCGPGHFLFDPGTAAVLDRINDPIQGQFPEEFGRSVASAGGNLVLTGDQEDAALAGVGYLIDLGSPGGALVHSFTEPVVGSYHFGGIVAAAGDNLVIASSAAFHVALYDAQTLQQLWSKSGLPGGVASLAADATHVAVGAGATFDDPVGHAYVYDRGGATTLTLNDPQPGVSVYANAFGSAIALTPTQVIVADILETVGTATYAGAFYVFDRATGALVQSIPNPVPKNSTFFANAMVTVGPFLVVGDSYAGPAGQKGIVYVYAPCGDGVIDPGQECDDGNLDPGDACDPNCRFPGCGNGYLDTAAGEVCDDGNLVGGDGCRADCTAETCGDGILDPQESCDDGNTNAGDACDPNCRPPGCGNSYVGAGEACDDGNVASGDCCSPSCQLDAAGTACAAGFGQCNVGGTCVGIPTLGEWGVIVGSLLMLLAVLHQRRRPA